MRCRIAILTLSVLLGAAGSLLAQIQAELPARFYRNGDETLKAFSAVAQSTRQSVVKLNVDGETVALAAVVDRNGHVITKASEIKSGKLTAWLSSGNEVDARVIAADDDHDLALVKVESRELRPVVWSEGETAIGQWAITPGIIETPHAVGIVSSVPRRIRHARAFIGIQFDVRSPVPSVGEIIPGLGAEQVGLRAGDLILSVNGAEVTNRVQVVEMLREFREGQQPRFRIRREETEFEVEIPMKVPSQAQLGEGFSRSRAARMDGAVSTRTEGFESVIQHDTALKPWLCGGPLLNLQGRVIGLNIARVGRVATYAIPAPLLKGLVADMLNRVQTSNSRQPGDG